VKKGLWILLAVAVAGPGCASCRVARDQDGLRKAVLDLNTNQIMDNLIRLDKGLPIVHIDYFQLTGQVTDTVGGEGDFEQTVHDAQSFPLLVLREVSDVWTGKLTATRENQVSVIGQPVTNNPEVYNAYLAYYAKPGHLMKTAEPPPPGEALLVRCAEPCCDDAGCRGPAKGLWGCRRHKADVVYYWIPCACKEDFRELCLYAVVMRGQIQGVPDYFEANILGVTDVTGDDKKDFTGRGQVTVTIILDREVPNAEGALIATIKGRRYEKKELLVGPLPKTTPAQPPGPGRPETISTTKRLELTFAFGPGQRRVPGDPNDAIAELTRQPVRLKFDRFNPPVPTTSDLLQQIRNQLELIRLGQQLRHVP
jgi:hypothetical protein